MFETIKKYAVYIGIFIIVVGLAGGLGYMFGLRAGNKSASGDAVTSTVQRITELNGQTGAAVDSAAAAVSDADRELDGAAAAIDQAAGTATAVQDRVSSSQEGLAECQKLAQQCAELNSRAKSILGTAQPADKGGKTQK